MEILALCNYPIWNQEFLMRLFISQKKVIKADDFLTMIFLGS
ncbi:Uncharacterised protein [Sphingobacterium mizutaii]|uniref:Uncharacterized protein n=1 Tax=Sphingobacterium mizutaii TaxID=1010 RepID=A0AAJ4XCF1_9SPHI|nr:hypothetical protein SAMN05192578_1011398 [Sphingobacterium mizutaii]SNV51750.1 Uncharacterised protein [Sphingobacterium mizutaii]